MLEMFVDFIEIESKLRTDLFPESFLKVFDLAGILDEQAGACYNIAFFDAGVLFSLEEAGIGSGERFLLADAGDYFHRIFLVSISCHVINVDSFGLVGAA